MRTALEKLQKALKVERTAKLLAKKTGVSVPTIYRQLAALRKLGAKIREVSSPSGKTGPVPTWYFLLRAAK